MIVFLVDADNLSAPAWVHEALTALVGTEGNVAVRRAYGSAENLRGLGDTLKTWAIRPFVNLSLTKNTTDIALASDAMEFACQTPPPAMIVIGSGDADFVPLVVRLREKGIQVVCISERGKMAAEAVSAYDKVILVGTAKASATDAKPSADVEADAIVSKPKAALSPKPDPVTKAAANKSPAKKSPAKKVAAKKAVALTPGAAVDELSVARILEAVPSLANGEWLHLGDAAKALHDRKLLGKNASSTKLFNKYSNVFELTPKKQPNQVRFVGKHDAD